MTAARIRIYAGLLIVLALLAYSNSFGTPFVFDDHDVVERNPSIRRLSTALFPPRGDGMTVSGRPLVNLSLAINHAAGGLGVTGYHVVNFSIHVLAALTLFGLVRRTLSERVARPWAPPVAALAAFSIALVWALHPLQTESVTYIAQRAESMVSLFYLLTLYCFVRAAAPDGGDVPAGRTRRISPRTWLVLSVLACVLGMASKEIMVSAPLAVLAYDAVFVGGGFAAAFRRRVGYYAALFSTLILLAVLVAGSGSRGGTAGLDAGIPVWNYVLTQCGAVARYVRLVFWPDPLIFDHGAAFVRLPGEVVLAALFLIFLFSATINALVRVPRIGLLAVAFFALLAPTSSFVPVASQTVAEHRMYLASAAIIAIVGMALWRFVPRAAAAVMISWALVLGALTFSRNRVYASEIALWEDNVRKLPSNARGHANLGKAYLEAERLPEAVVELQTAIRIGPPSAEAHFNLGLLAQKTGQIPAARGNFEAATRINPRYAEAHNNLSLMLDAEGRLPEALAAAQRAVESDPSLLEARVNLGNFLGRSGMLREALVQFEAAIALDPVSVPALANYATALFQGNRMEDARAAIARACELDPGDASLHERHGLILLQLNRRDEAAAALRRALEIDPTLPGARQLLQRATQ